MVRRLVQAIRRRIRTHWALANARRTSRQRLDRGQVRRLLVVCYGNIYRSAFVGEFLRRQLDASIEVRSTGFHPVAGRPAPAAHVKMCQALGVELSTHRSAIIQAEDLAWADTIVLMDRHNWDALDAMGANPEKLVWLGSLLPGDIEIADPYGMGDDDARRIVIRMHEAAQTMLSALRDRGGAR
jgi:protein-tyrosine-phosphatase